MYDPSKPYKEQILALIKFTWQSPYISIKESTYSIIEKKFNYPEVDHTDGIGTKGIYHWQKRSFKSAVLDALAMNLNDLVLVRAIPYKLQNHIAIPEDDKDAILEIIKTLAEECQKRQIAITGGETSIHNNIDGMDLSITLSGFVKDIQANKFEVGDVLIGLKSSGLHSNGLTKAREVLGEQFRPEFIEPTIIYSDTILPVLQKYDIHGMMHITGGAFTKLKPLLDNADVLIFREHQLQPQTIFRDLHQQDVADEEMYKTFNCGVGFILSVRPNDVNNVIAGLDLDVDIIGKIVPGNGKVKIQSAFSSKEIEL